MTGAGGVQTGAGADVTGGVQVGVGVAGGVHVGALASKLHVL